MATYGIYLVTFLIFVAVVIFVEGAYLLWDSIHQTGAVKMQNRLRALSAGGAHGTGATGLLRTKVLSDIPLLNRWLTAIPRVHAIDHMLVQADLNLSVMKFFGIQAATAVVSLGILQLFSKLPLSLAIVSALIMGVSIPYLYVVRLGSRRRERFIRQFPDALDFMARSLRAGNPFAASIRIASEEMPDPVSKEFGIMFDEMNYGLDLEDALHNFSSRIDCEETRYFVTAVTIQKVTGGNLADVLNKISEVMRERVKTKNEIQVQAAEMRLSAYVLLALPFVVAAAVLLFNPGYFKPLLQHPMGLVIIGVQIVLMVVGYVVVRRMIHFRI